MVSFDKVECDTCGLLGADTSDATLVHSWYVLVQILTSIDSECADRSWYDGWIVADHVRVIEGRYPYVSDQWLKTELVELVLFVVRVTEAES